MTHCFVDLGPRMRDAPSVGGGARDDEEADARPGVGAGTEEGARASASNASDAEAAPALDELSRGSARHHSWLSGWAGMVLFAVFLLLPTLPANRATEALAPVLKAVSLRQSWGMYAPNPARSYAQLELEGVDRQGVVTELQETQLARDGWGTASAFTRSREDYWRYAVARYGRQRQDMNRIWYLRSICVREARAGRPLREVTAYRVYRKFRGPAKVREGRSELIKEERTLVGTMECTTKTVRDMVATHQNEDHSGASREPALRSGPAGGAAPAAERRGRQ